MTVLIDDKIFQLQATGGISHLWRNVLPHLQERLPQVEWNGHGDIFLSTYYAPAPPGYRSAVVCYDFIAERYSPVGYFHADAIRKRGAIAAADSVIAISQWVADDCQTYVGKAAQVAYCGTNMRRADAQAVDAFRAKYHLDHPYVLVIGNRHLYKNVQSLYQAWQFFAGREAYSILCVGGEDVQWPEHNFRTQWPGQWQHERLSDSEMASAYTGAAMLVYPSLYEGFGLPVLEAMACGCPVVCGQRGAIPEVASDTAYYADVFRPLSIAEAMSAALTADIARQQHAMQRAQGFTWARMAEQIIEALQEMPADD